MGGSEIQSVSDLRAQRACAHITERNLKRTRAAHSAQLEIDSGSPLLCAAALLSLLCSSPLRPSSPPITPASFAKFPLCSHPPFKFTRYGLLAY